MNIYKCDICGAEIIHEKFSRLDIQRKDWSGNDYRDVNLNGFSIYHVMDVCDKCFREKLVEVLNMPKDCLYSKSLEKIKEE